jgi:hypothetical protein
MKKKSTVWWSRESWGCPMDEKDFEGTLVLERLAEVGRVDDFFDAIDSDDIERATSLMKKAKIDATTIATVVRKMQDEGGEH